MAMVNPMLSPLQVKDSRWLTLEVCREFTRLKCTRSDQECKFAHPPPHVEVQNGRVTCCFDSIKGKCQRKDPPCKYLHPPQHLREQLLQNGRNNLILKNLQMQALISGMQPVVPGVIPTIAAPNPYLAMQTTTAFNPYASVGVQSVVQANEQTSPSIPALQNGQVIASNAVQQKGSRTDRLESTPSSSPSVAEPAVWSGSYIDSIAPSSQFSPIYFQGMSMPGMVPVMKRAAVADAKSGLPMYQPMTNAAVYQQAALAAMHQQPFVPVTNCDMIRIDSAYLESLRHSVAGHPVGVPRF